MNRCFLLGILIVLTVSVSFASVGVYAQMPVDAAAGSEIPVKVTINTDEDLTGFDFSAFLPTDSEIISWDLTGLDKTNIVQEQYTHDFMGGTYSLNHWKFNSLPKGSITLTYSFRTQQVSDVKIISLWFYPTGFDNQKSTIRITPKITSTTPSPLTGSFIAPTVNSPAAVVEQNTRTIEPQKTATSEIFSGLNQLFSQKFY